MLNLKKWRLSLIIVVLIMIVLGTLVHSTGAAPPIKIASLFSHTGQAAAANRASIRGVRLAKTEINARGGVLGRPLKLLELDNRSMPIGSKIAAQQAVREEVTAIIGAAFSTHTLAAAKIAQAHAMPLISNVSTHPDITAIGDCIFRVCFNDLYQGSIMARFARYDLEVSTAAIFIDLSSHYSQGLARTFQTEFEQIGGRVLAIIPYKRTQHGFDAEAAQAVDVAPQAVFIPGHEESALIMTALLKHGFKAHLLGTDGWDIENFLRIGGQSIPRGFYSTHWSKESEHPVSKAYVARYQRDHVLATSEVLAYDALMVLADAIQRAGSIDRMAIREALAQTRHFEGVTGSISFTPQGDPLKSAVIMQIRDGRPHYYGHVNPPIHPIESPIRP